MAVPDFAASRRQLRRARVQDALQLQRQGVVVDRHRDRLLELLVRASTDSQIGFEELPDDTVDTVVSLALCELDEPAEDQLVVILMCLQVLAQDGQFARLALLARRLGSIGRRFEIERPFLAAAVAAFRLALTGRERQALRRLERILGIGDTIPDRQIRSSREQLDDILAAASLRAQLRGPDQGEFIAAARQAALQVADGGLLAFVDTVRAWGTAVDQARPQAVLKAADPTFRDPALAAYVERRAVQALFPAQIKAIAAGATRDENQMVSLPTSSGKTLIAEFRIAAALTRKPGGKAIYVAPYRLLARQVENNLKQHLGPALGLSVRDLGSGYDPTAIGSAEADIVICTPERLDALLRLSTSDKPGAHEAADLFDRCCALVLDELHLVARPGRGPRFELLLARLKYKHPNLQVLGLSAASLGTDELAEWIGDTDAISGARRPTGTLELVWDADSDLYQRVSRRAPTRVAELPRGNAALDDAASLLLRLSDRYQPALAVCVSRTSAESLAGKLVKRVPEAGMVWRDSLNEIELRELTQAIEEVRALMGDDHPLAHYMASGIAFHHAGVPTHALQQIERLASRRLIRAVTATTTVAEGADLPFRVVVIPHLNFPGSTRRLERDLYLNIIGRAGRANVSVEGVVFLLDSNARTLKNHIRGSLWTTAAGDRIRGGLPYIDPDAQDIDELNTYLEVQGQVMGWLGDGDNYIAGQAQVLAETTLSYTAGNNSEKRAVVGLLDRALADLERSGFALAATPYRLTEHGRAARLTGLSPPSVNRLRVAIDQGINGWLRDLPDTTELSEDLAAQIARLVFEAGEVFQHSLWLRREVGSDPQGKLRALQEFAYEQSQNHQDSETFISDIDLLSRWIMGDSYLELGRRAPTFDRTNALFGGENETKRTSDATEYIGKLTYPASWVWSGTQILIGELGEAIPSFIKGAIEYGLSTETAVQLVAQGALTRRAATFLARECGPVWLAARGQLSDEAFLDEVDPYLTRLDFSRLQSMSERLRVEAI